MKVRTKLIIGFSLIVVLIWLITIYAGENYGNLQSQFTAVEEDIIPRTIAMTEVEKVANEAYNEVMKYVLYDVAESKEASLSCVSRLKEIWMAYLPQGGSSDVQEFDENRELMAKLNEFNLAIGMMINMKERGASSGELLMRDRSTTLPALLDVQQLTTERKAIGIIKLGRVKTAFATAYASGMRSLYITAGLITLLAIGAAILVIRSIVRPLHSLHKGTEMIAQGKLDYKVGTGARDEIGQLSRAFDQMTRSLSGSMTSIDKLNQEIAERKRMEEALRESEETYEKLFELLPVGITILDFKGMIKYCNPAVYNKGGYPEGDYSGKHFSRISSIRVKDIPKYIRLFNSILRGKIPEPFDAPYQRKDGTIGWTELNIGLLKIGGKQRILVIQYDISERKRAEEALREREKRFSDIAENAIEWIWEVDAKGKYTYSSPVVEKILGYKPDEIIGKYFYEFFHPEDKEEMKKAAFEAFAQKQPFHEFINRNVQKNGQIVFLSTSGVPVIDEAGKLLGYRGVDTDITERKRTEEALANEAIRRRILIEQSLDGIVVLDEDSKVYEANQRFVEMLGYTSEEIRELHTWDWDTQWTREELLEMGRNVDAAGYHLETYHRRKDGTNIDVEISVNGAVCAGQKLIFCVCRDITERKRAEEALRESEDKFSKAFHSSPDVISIVNLDNHKFIDINDSFTRYTGYTREEVIGHTSAEVRIWSDVEERDRILRMLKEKGSVNNEEIHTLTKSGDIRIGLFSAEKINIGGEKCSITVIVDITERKEREQLQNDENYVLTLLGQGAELSEILEAIVHLGESRDPSIKGSVLLYDSTRNWLNAASGPSLPDDYSELMKDGVPVGPNMGSCGTAAYLKERVIIPDIENSPFFEQFEAVVERATKNNLLACWSQPIIASNGDVLGTIANYSNKVGEPDNDNLMVLEWSARIAAIAIERKQAEQALRESEEKFSKAFRSSPETIAITTLKGGKFLEVNNSFTRITGYAHEEVIGHSSIDIGIWAEADDRARMIKILQEKGRVYNEEFKFRMKSGEIRTWLFSAEHINIGGEKCLISITTDITERKRAEQALRESEEKFSKAFRSSPDAIAITTLKDGKFIEVNDSYTRINGYTREEVIGHSSAEFGVWANTEERNRIIHTVKERGRVSNEEAHLYLKSGKIMTCLFSAELINIDGEPCMISLAIDITRRKRAEEELKNALSNLEQSSAQLAATNKELEAFSYSVSHDLRSPLRSIDGFSQALLEDYTDKLDDDGQDYLRRLRGASQKMGELIDGLLKLSRLTRSEIRREKVDLSALAKEITARLKETQPERHVDFVIGRGLTVSGDRQLLRVLMENLLGNAWKFTGKREQAKIEFGATQNGEKKAYFVKDNGAGFDMTYADRLFSAFQRLHETTEFPGTGIGLATVQRIINRHGGSVWAEGAEEKGATFYFTLN